LHSLGGPKRPELLFDVFKDKNKDLLLLGCNFPDWLTRFFLRLLSEERLDRRRGSDRVEFIADHETPTDSNLVVFLRNARVELYEGTSAVAFVKELYRRWKEGNEGKEEPVIRKPISSELVFLSYASEDRPKAIRLKNALRDAGLNVWLDQRGGLEIGDEYESVIEESIVKSKIFLACISENTVRAKPDRFFRTECRTALGENAMKGRPFIWPILLDETEENNTGIPPKLREFHMARCPNGVPSVELVSLMTRKLREAGDRTGGAL
jgi:hypothetical protein